MILSYEELSLLFLVLFLIFLSFIVLIALEIKSNIEGIFLRNLVNSLFYETKIMPQQELFYLIFFYKKCKLKTVRKKININTGYVIAVFV